MCKNWGSGSVDQMSIYTATEQGSADPDGAGLVPQHIIVDLWPVRVVDALPGSLLLVDLSSIEIRPTPMLHNYGSLKRTL